MKEASYKKMLSALLITSILSALALGYIYEATYDKIKENNEEMIASAVYDVLPGIESYEEIKREPLIFRGYIEEEVAGYAVYAGGTGFQGEIKLMVGFSKDMSVTGVSILESVETPGLGDRVREPAFLSQFIGRDAEKINKEINALTGATVSSGAVHKILRRAFDEADDIL